MIFHDSFPLTGTSAHESLKAIFSHGCFSLDTPLIPLNSWPVCAMQMFFIVLYCIVLYCIVAETNQ